MAANLIREYLDTIILMEGMNYEDMFSGYLHFFQGEELMLNSMKAKIKQEVLWAKKALVKNNRIVWYLRWYRLHLVTVSCVQYKTHDDESKAAFAKLKDYLSDLVREAEKHGASRAGEHARATITSYVREFLQHIFSLPVPSIQSYPLDWKPITVVTADLKRFEDVWKENANRLIPVTENEGTHVALDCGNGYKWVCLNKKYCDKEADAMGHCGNQYGATGDVIYSLRRLVKKGQATYWEPFLTFIVDKNKMLGESKGRGNDKPADRYHGCILQFLESDLVNGIKGGGYDPANNFETSDLTEDQQTALFDKKPMMAPIPWIYKHHGMSPALGERLKTTLEASDIPVIGWNKDYSHIRLYKFSNWTDIISSYGTREAISLLKSYEDGLGSWDFDVSDSEVRDLFNDLPQGSYPLIAQSIIKEEGEDAVNAWIEDNGLDFDPNDRDDVWDMMEHFDSEFKNHLEGCVSDGYQTGTEIEVQKALIASVRDGVSLGNDQYDISAEFDNPENKIVWDEECWLSMPVQQIILLLTDAELVEEVMRNGWFFDEKFTVQEPHYGFSGYDEDTAMERVFEEYPQFDPKPAEKMAA
jgi:hypothetical protein